MSDDLSRVFKAAGAATLWEAMIHNNVARHQLNALLGDALAIHICPACQNFGYKKTKRSWPAPTHEPCHCEHGEGKPSWKQYLLDMEDDIPF